MELKFDFLEQKKHSSMIVKKQKSLPQNPRAVLQSKEKSASDHMTLAEKKLTHFQKHQQSKSPLPKTSSSNTNTTSSSTKSKPKENIKIPSKPSKVCRLPIKITAQAISFFS
jgi:hypothetical protein